MLRIGTKYQISHLREDVVSRLNAWFPLKHVQFRLHRPWQRPGSALKEFVALVDVLQQCGLETYLPVVFFCCAQLDPQSLMDGYQDSDGNKWRLSRTDLTRCLKGQLWLRQMVQKQSNFIFANALGSLCASQTSCSLALQSSLSQLRERFAGLFSGVLHDPYSVQWMNPYVPMCASCAKKVGDWNRQFYDEIWKNLATQFDVSTTWPVPEDT